MVEMFVSILEVKISNLTNGVFMLSSGKLTEYYIM
jgi:hypothetical protein